MRETDLYPPVKAFLQDRGFAVKAEIGPADVVAMRDGEMLVVELKLGFSLALIQQAVARQALTDRVYIAVAEGRGRAFRAALKRMRPLCRRLSLGLMTVDGDRVRVWTEPAPYRPRLATRPRARIETEFARRRGDPNAGGACGPRVTAYRQDALTIAAHLAASGPSRGADVARATGVARATRMMADDHYGWFDRVARGVYALSATGRAATGATAAA